MRAHYSFRLLSFCFFGLLALLNLSACESPSGPSGPVAISLAPRDTTVLVGDTLHLRATITDRLGTSLSDTRLTWTSSDTAIARVDSAGVIWTNRLGTTMIAVSAGDLRDSTRVTVREPEPVAWKQIITGARLTCGIIEDDQLYCWRILGDNPERWELTQGYLLPDQQFTALSVGSFGGCGLTANREVYCWDVLGAGEPYMLPGEARFRQISGDFYHGCGITTDGKTFCWHSDPGIAGARTWAGMRPLENDPGFAYLVGGRARGCGITAEGVAYCWGDNRWGGLGDGTRISRESAARVKTDLRFAEIQSSCARTANGQLYCWGYNDTYGVGVDHTERAGCDFYRQEDHYSPFAYNHLCTVPQPVSTTLRFSQVRTGAGGPCALTLDGKPYCWGVNISWNLGVPPDSITYRTCRLGANYPCTPIPTAVLGDFSFTSIGLSSDLHRCGLTAEGAAYCWGRVSEEGMPLGYVDISRGIAPPVRLREPLRIPNTSR